MLRSQSISNINDSTSNPKKLSSTNRFLNSFRKSSISGSASEKRKSRPLSQSISTLNLKISSPKLQQQQQQQQQQNISDEDKENHLPPRLKTRSSAPNLKKQPSSTSVIATSRMMNLGSKRNYRHSTIFNNIAFVNDDHSPTTTIDSVHKSDSIFDQSSIIYIDDEETSSLSSIQSSQNDTTINSNEFKLPKSNHVHNLNEFIKSNKISLSNVRKSLEVEKNEIINLNQIVKDNTLDLNVNYRLIENFLCMTIENKIETTQPRFFEDIDYDTLFKKEVYIDDEDLYLKL